MNDEPHDPLAERFDRARQQIEREVDARAGLERLHNRRDRSPRLLAAGLAAALVLVIAAGAFFANVRSSDDVVADGSEATPEVLEFDLSRLCEVRDALMVTIGPSTRPEQFGTVRAEMATIDGVASVDYLDRARVQETFRPAFVDEPDVLETADPQRLPRMLWLTLDVGTPAAEVLDAVRAVEGVEAVEHAPTSPCPLDGTFSTEGYGVVIDGDVVAPEAIQAKALTMISEAYAPNAGFGQADFDRRLVAAVTSEHLLAAYGRERGEPVTDADVDDAILGARETGRVDRPGETIDPAAAVDDPEIRRDVRVGLERSRGMSLVIAAGGTDRQGPLDGLLQSWIAERLATTRVEATTPTGEVDDDTIARYGLGESAPVDDVQSLGRQPAGPASTTTTTQP